MRSLGLLAALAVALAPATPAADPPPPDDFVHVSGPDFTLHGRPFRFVGANLAVMHGEPWRSRYADTIAAAARDGLTVGRIWALGEGPPDAEGWERDDRLFRAGPDGWIEQTYVHLDRVLAEARARGLRLIITLANNWGDYGGVPMYLRWAGIDTDRYGAKRHFFTDERIRAWYRAHLERLVTRRNSVTGVRYRDDPTILAWELMNESTIEPEGMAARRAWIVEMSRFLRDRDPHHLISPGLLGYDTVRDREEWLRVMQLPVVDYCDAHLYPQDHHYKLPDRAAIERAVDDVAQLARFVARKPLVFGEIGFRAYPPTWQGQDRAAWFDAFLGRAFDDGAAGVLVWVYEPWRGRGRRYGIYIDEGRTAAVRAALRRQAERLAGRPAEVRNPALGPARGAAPLLDQFVTVTDPKKIATKWRTADDGSLVLDIPPEQFAAARWERLGTWDGGTLVHAYGSESGYFEYRFELPRGRQPRELRIRARLSSEYPGVHSPPDGLSRVTVSLDGGEVAALLALADDGIGRWYEITVSDAAVLGRLARGTHALRFTVPEGPHCHGLAIYGRNTGKGTERVDDGGPLELRLRLAD